MEPNTYLWIQARNGVVTQVEALNLFKSAYRLSQPEGPLTHWHIKMFMPSEAEVHRRDGHAILISYNDEPDAAGDLVANYIMWRRYGNEGQPSNLPIPREHQERY